MKAEHVSSREVLKHFQNNFEDGVRKAQLLTDIVSTRSFEERAVRYSTVKQLLKLGAEFYVLHDPQKFFFPVKPKFLRFLPVITWLSRLRYVRYEPPARVGNSLYIPLPLRLGGVLSAYVGEVDERPYSTPFDNSIDLDTVAMDTDTPEFREWFGNTVNHIRRYRSLYGSYGIVFPPQPQGRTVVFSSKTSSLFADSTYLEPLWPSSEYFTAFQYSYVVLTDEEVKRRREAAEKYLREAREHESRRISILKNIEAKYTPVFRNDDVIVYAIQPEDVAGFFDDTFLEKVKGVAENLYCIKSGRFFYHFNRVNRGLSLPLNYLKALRVMGRGCEGVYETSLPMKPRRLVAVCTVPMALSSENSFYVAVGFTPRRHQEINTSMAKVVRTPKRIIFLQPPEDG